MLVATAELASEYYKRIDAKNELADAKLKIIQMQHDMAEDKRDEVIANQTATADAERAAAAKATEDSRLAAELEKDEADAVKTAEDKEAEKQHKKLLIDQWNGHIVKYNWELGKKPVFRHENGENPYEKFGLEIDYKPPGTAKAEGGEESAEGDKAKEEGGEKAAAEEAKPAEEKKE